MAGFTRRYLATGLSVLWLVALTVVAGYALHNANYFSLPIANVYAALTVALPPLAGVALETIISFQHRRAARGTLQGSKLFQAVNAAFLIYEAVLATLAGTRLGPVADLFCPLQDRWRTLYMAKDATRVRRIQDAFDCCGFNSVRDMPFPFPAQNRGVDATTCAVSNSRNARCLEPWRATEQHVAIMLLVVPIGVFVWKLVLFLAPGLDTPWLPSAIRLPPENTTARSRQAIEYRDEEDGAEDRSVGAVVNQLNTDSNLASQVESGRLQPSALLPEERSNEWNREN